MRRLKEFLACASVFGPAGRPARCKRFRRRRFGRFEERVGAVGLIEIHFQIFLSESVPIRIAGTQTRLCPTCRHFEKRCRPTWRSEANPLPQLSRDRGPQDGLRKQCEANERPSTS